MATIKKQSALESAKAALADAKKERKAPAVSSAIDAGDDSQRPFTKINFYMMAACVAMIVIGFLLMSGGGSDNPTAFNPEIFSTRRIVVGPAIAFLGFLLMAFAIIYTPKGGSQGNAKEAKD
ncbi:MAG: DUF3098 domain-containing protein [Muribaculaceae bacterium]|nr:DUF3098 domain-containing protein [Muribaculaceae bacterium]